MSNYNKNKNNKKKTIKDELVDGLTTNLYLTALHSTLSRISNLYDKIPRHNQEKFEGLVIAWLISSICHKHPQNHWPDSVESKKITDEVISIIERRVEQIAAYKRIKEKESLR